MKTYGLLGFPLGHSFSQQYFTEKFAREGVAAQYLNFEVEVLTHETLCALLSEYPSLHGFNVTIPHKRTIIPLLDAISPEAEAIGAVNVVRVGEDGRLTGMNSDAEGFRLSLQHLLAERPRPAHALVLGTGGASRAVCHVLRDMGIVPRLVSRHRADTVSYTYEDITPELLVKHLLVVNCTPLGMFPHVETLPCLPYGALTPVHALFDLVYNPAVTRFMAEGEKRGARVCCGLEMLHAQAEVAWKMWNE